MGSTLRQAITYTHKRTHVHTHTKPNRWFPPLCVSLAFLSVHQAPQEMAFVQKCAHTDIKFSSEPTHIGLMLKVKSNISFRTVLWDDCEFENHTIGSSVNISERVKLGALLLLFVSYFPLNSKPLSPNRPNTAPSCLAAHSFPASQQLPCSH